MKGVYGRKNISKLEQLLTEIHSTLPENQGTISFFIIHYSFLISISKQPANYLTAPFFKFSD
jgi:hypothetical protein